MKYLIVACALFLSSKVTGQEKLKTENVFIITFDGLRWQEVFNGADSALMGAEKYVEEPGTLKTTFWADTPEARRKKLMPFFWSTLSSTGQLYGNRKYDNFVNCTNQMWFSYPGYNEILCGFADDEHIHSNDKLENPNVTVLEFLSKQTRFKNKIAAFGSWDVFPYILHEKRSGIPVNAGAESATGKSLSQREIFLNEIQPQYPVIYDGMRMDVFTHHYAFEYVKREQPNVVFISYGETDDFAHSGKYDRYLHSARQTDAFIALWWTYLQSTPKYKDKTTLIITTDHGRGTIPLDTWRSHGKDIQGADQIWIAVIGPDTKPAGEVKKPGQYYQNQIAATTAELLGVDYKNDKKTGTSLKPAIRTKAE